jgi:hypothetical protein
MTSRIWRICICAAFALGYAGSVAGAETPPGGVYAIVDAASPAQYDLAREVLARSDVDGLLIHLRWADVNPSEKSYDWRALNAAIRLVTDAHKRFEIGIVTGKDTPVWVINGSTYVGKFSYNAAMAHGCNDDLKIVAPYDEVYLRSFHELLRALNRDLVRNGTYGQLSMLKLFGITTTTNELRLPATAPKDCDKHDPVNEWVRLHYLPVRVHHAWREMLHMYLESFPDKSFNIGFIGINAFPGIREDGVPAPEDRRADVSARFTEELINEAAAAMPGRLALGFDSLTLYGMNKSYATYLNGFYLAAIHAGNLPLGFQTNELLQNYPAGGAACGGSSPSDAKPCASSKEFEGLLFAGLGMSTPPGLGTVYLELFPQNIVLYPSGTAPARKALIPWQPPQPIRATDPPGRQRPVHP